MKKLFVYMLSYLLVISPIVKAEDISLESDEYSVIRKLRENILKERASIIATELLLEKVVKSLTVEAAVVVGSAAFVTIPLGDIAYSDRVIESLIAKEKIANRIVNKALPSTRSMRSLIEERQAKIFLKGGSSLPLLTAKTLRGAKNVKIALIGTSLTMLTIAIGGTVLATIDFEKANAINNLIKQKKEELNRQEKIYNILLQEHAEQIEE